MSRHRDKIGHGLSLDVQILSSIDSTNDMVYIISYLPAACCTIMTDWEDLQSTHQTFLGLLISDCRLARCPPGQ